MIILYIAMSLDGYIADLDGGVAWINGDGSENDAIGSYERFIQEIDVIIMGRKTYDQITQELSPHSWPYPNQHTYIFTRHPTPSLPNLSFTQDFHTLLPNLKDKKVWLCGGANLVHQFLELGYVDELHISIIPMLLGNGISLFPQSQLSYKLKLLGTESYNGITDLRYAFRK
ncbi:dihydrofolate reductase family protein [Helicobacter pametensis]|uniref:dihydrofolate reductase family protein n=1 Tax=Helicobacter pametensis TaxID=95149 RepID=UPI0004846A7C|nr:dihydrofolate reductase family protein [Helicobacter pametensis]